MSIPVLAASVIALAGLLLGLLPERHRPVPALPFVALAPWLLMWLAVAHGPAIASLWTVALSALFRGPIVYWLRRLSSRRRPGSAGPVG